MSKYEKTFVPHDEYLQAIRYGKIEGSIVIRRLQVCIFDTWAATSAAYSLPEKEELCGED